MGGFILYYGIKSYSEMNYFEDLQRVGLMTENNSSADIRLFTPLSLLNGEDFTVYSINGADRTQFKKDLNNDIVLVDILVIGRSLKSLEIAKTIVEKCKLNNVKIIFEIDDDLINIDETHPHYYALSKYVEIVKYLTENADEVVVSTDYLKTKILEYNSNVSVIHNVLTPDWDMDNANLKDSKTFKIGYMGTITHKYDLNLVEEAMKNVYDYFSDKNQDFVFEVIGGSDEELDWAEQIEVPKEKSDYPTFTRWLQETVNWDLALAPIEDTPINRSKSNIKYLEYTGLNVPGVYSNIGPYKETIVHGKTGLLAENTVESWQENIIRLIEDENLREDILKNAREDIKSNYLLDDVVQSWIEVLSNNKKVKNKEYYEALNESIISKVDVLFKDNVKIHNSNKNLKKGNKNLKKENKKLKKENKKIKKGYDKIKNSKSWRITKPLRKIISLFRRNK